MALDAYEQAALDLEVGVWLKTMPNPGIRSIMLSHGRAGHAAAIVDVAAEIAVILNDLYGQAAPTVLP